MGVWRDLEASVREGEHDGGRPPRDRLPRWKRYLLTAAGVVSLGLGALGVVLPLLPTTPFLLLAAACFFRSSDRLYDWLMRHRWFGPYIRNYREHRAIALGAKVGTLTLLWVTLAFTGLVVMESWWVRLMLLAVGVGVTWHVLSLRTLTPEMLAQDAPAACDRSNPTIAEE